MEQARHGHNADGAFEASGINGRMIHISPAAEMVVIKPAPHPGAGAGSAHPPTLPAWAALAQRCQAAGLDSRRAPDSTHEGTPRLKIPSTCSSSGATLCG